MTKRQAVIVLDLSDPNPEKCRYGVRYRELGFWPWSWTPWKRAVEFSYHDNSWTYEHDKFLVDQALVNGVVPSHGSDKGCQVIIELDEE